MYIFLLCFVVMSLPGLTALGIRHYNDRKRRTPVEPHGVLINRKHPPPPAPPQPAPPPPPPTPPIDHTLILANPNQLLLDIDNIEQKSIFARNFDRLRSKLNLIITDQWTSSGGNSHVVVEFDDSPTFRKDRDFFVRSALRQALGSDPHLEAVAIAHYLDGDPYPHYLFRPHFEVTPKPPENITSMLVEGSGPFPYALAALSGATPMNADSTRAILDESNTRQVELAYNPDAPPNSQLWAAQGWLIIGTFFTTPTTEPLLDSPSSGWDTDDY